METAIHELTAGYALDALELEDRRAYEAHLEHCEQCRTELASFWETTEALAVAASGPAPSAELRDRILASARAERQVVVPFEPGARRTVPLLAAATAVAAVAALAVGLWAMRLSDRLDETRSALERERTAAAVLADPGTRQIALAAGAGRLVVAPGGRAALVLEGLDRAPRGKTYALWIIEGSTPLPAGLFDGHDGTDVVPVEGTVDEGDVVAVTLEDGPVDAPSSDPIVASERV